MAHSLEPRQASLLILTATDTHVGLRRLKVSILEATEVRVRGQSPILTRISVVIREWERAAPRSRRNELFLLTRRDG